MNQREFDRLLARQELALRRAVVVAVCAAALALGALWLAVCGGGR